MPDIFWMVMWLKHAMMGITFMARIPVVVALTNNVVLQVRPIRAVRLLVLPPKHLVL